MPTDKLTDPKIRQAKPADKPYKLFDGGGLFLLVQPSGSKLWRLKYRFGGKERLLAIGSYDKRRLAKEGPGGARQGQGSIGGGH